MLKAKILISFAIGTIALSLGVFAERARAGSPSFNCAKTEGRAEELICGDRELALMDVEATRLFKLVRDGKNRPAEQKNALSNDRAHWMQVRNECWIADDFRACIIHSYAARIHALREHHAEARMSDDKGITRGPFDVHCKDMKQVVKATFIRSDPPVSAVQLSGRLHVGIGSGKRYVEKSQNGEMAFWTIGNQAFLQMPNGIRYDCVLKR